MFTLTLNRPDGTLVWTEYFNDEAAAHAWLAEEKTRSYWDDTLVASLVDSTPAPPPPPTPLDICHAKRLDEYPPIGDQLDALYKARQGNSSDQAVIDEKISAVKAKYPKPQAP